MPTLASGKVWYQGSTLNCERKTFEIQVFNPEHLGEATVAPGLASRNPAKGRPGAALEVGPVEADRHPRERVHVALEESAEQRGDARGVGDFDPLAAPEDAAGPGAERGEAV